MPPESPNDGTTGAPAEGLIWSLWKAKRISWDCKLSCRASTLLPAKDGCCDFCTTPASHELSLAPDRSRRLETINVRLYPPRMSLFAQDYGAESTAASPAGSPFAPDHDIQLLLPASVTQ